MEKAKIEMSHHVCCPKCSEKTSTIDHLLNTNITFGTWYCDHCGIAFQGKVENGEVFVELTGEHKDPAIVILQKDEIAIAVETNIYHFDDDYKKNHQYYYEEHTCPSNYFRDTKDVFNLKPKDYFDDDPHGLFTYIDTIICSKDSDENQDLIHNRIKKLREEYLNGQ